MKYVILIHSNAATQAHWDDLDDDQRLQFGLDHRAFGAALTASGELVTSAGLQPGDTAKSVTVRDGELTATDGPYAEAKEYLAGFYVVECTDIDHAIHLAARLPEAAYTHIEVRPVFDMTTLDHYAPLT